MGKVSKYRKKIRNETFRQQTRMTTVPPGIALSASYDGICEFDTAMIHSYSMALLFGQHNSCVTPLTLTLAELKAGKWLGGGGLLVETPFEYGTPTIFNTLPTIRGLERPSILTSPCRIHLDNEEDQDWVSRIWSGQRLSFVVDIAKPPTRAVTIECKLDDDTIASFVVHVLMDGLTGQVEHHLDSETVRRIPSNGNARALLLSRMVHLLARHFAVMIPLHILAGLLAKYLALGDYITRKHPEDFLDIAVLEADVKCNITIPYIVQAEQDPSLIGEHCASVVYQMAVQLVGNLIELRRIGEAESLCREAEQALPRHLGPLQIIRPHLLGLNGNDREMLETAVDYVQRSSHLPGTTATAETISEVVVALVDGLLSRYVRSKYKDDYHAVVGFLALYAESVSSDEMVFLGLDLSGFRGTLKARLRQGTRAHETLMQLFSTRSLDEFQGILRDSIVPTFAPDDFVRVAKGASPEQLLDRVRQRLRRVVLKYGRSSSILRERCDGCVMLVDNMSSRQLLHCPCGLVQYCSKDCQRHHWAFHKDTCSVYLSKQQCKVAKSGRSAVD